MAVFILPNSHSHAKIITEEILDFSHIIPVSGGWEFSPMDYHTCESDRIHVRGIPCLLSHHPIFKKQSIKSDRYNKLKTLPRWDAGSIAP